MNLAKRKLRLLLVGSFTGVLLLWAGSWWYFVSCYSGFQNWSDRGSFGDMFGAVNALFAALALAFVIVTLYLQIKSTEEARQDSEEERFQGIFFRLVELQQNVLNGIERHQAVRGGIAMLSGRRLFSDFYVSLSNQFDSLYMTCSTSGSSIRIIVKVGKSTTAQARMCESYATFHQEHSRNY